MGEPALQLVRDLGGDWDEDPEPVMVRTAAAEAAVRDDAEPAPMRVRAHQRPGAPARVKSSVQALPPIGAALLAEITASMRASTTAGAPWEVQPPSVVDLHQQVMRRAGIFDAVPALKVCYIGLGHVCLLACAAGYWATWAFFGSPGRLALSVALYFVLSATGFPVPHIQF